MSELRDKIRKELKRLQMANLSTITVDGLPWTRYVMISADQDLIIRCATFIDARKVDQIKKNPEVHLTCGVSSPLDMGVYYQIQGRAEVVTTAAEKKAFWNPSLEFIFKGADDPTYAVIVVKPYRIELCALPQATPEVLEF